MLLFWLLLKILFVYILSVKQRIAWFSQQVIYWEARLLIRALGEKKLELSKSRSKIQKQVELIKADESDGRITDYSDGCHEPLWQTQMGHVWTHLNDNWCTVLNHECILE